MQVYNKIGAWTHIAEFNRLNFNVVLNWTNSNPHHCFPIHKSDFGRKVVSQNSSAWVQARHVLLQHVCTGRNPCITCSVTAACSLSSRCVSIPRSWWPSHRKQWRLASLWRTFRQFYTSYLIWFLGLLLGSKMEKCGPCNIIVWLGWSQLSPEGWLMGPISVRREVWHRTLTLTEFSSTIFLISY